MHRPMPTRIRARSRERKKQSGLEMGCGKPEIYLGADGGSHYRNTRIQVTHDFLQRLLCGSRLERSRVAIRWIPGNFPVDSNSAWLWLERWPAVRRSYLRTSRRGNLDSKNGEAVMELLRELHAEGATICMVRHDQRYSNSAERTVHLFDGQ